MKHFSLQIWLAWAVFQHGDISLFVLLRLSVFTPFETVIRGFKGKWSGSVFFLANRINSVWFAERLFFKLTAARVFSCSDDSSKRGSLASEKIKYLSGTNGVNILQHTLIGNWNFAPLSSRDVPVQLLDAPLDSVILHVITSNPLSFTEKCWLVMKGNFRRAKCASKESITVEWIWQNDWMLYLPEMQIFEIFKNHSRLNIFLLKVICHWWIG